MHISLLFLQNQLRMLCITISWNHLDLACVSSDGKVSQKDVTKDCRGLIALLKHAKSRDQRVTALKLLDAWFGKAGPVLRISSVSPPSVSRQEGERWLVHFLLQGYLQEDFHFTPYTTISYILPGTTDDDSANIFF